MGNEGSGRAHMTVLQGPMFTFVGDILYYIDCCHGNKKGKWCSKSYRIASRQKHIVAPFVVTFQASERAMHWAAIGSGRKGVLRCY